MSIPPRHLETIEEYTRKIAIALNVRGLMNIQYAIAADKVYVLEANPRASRTVPLVSKVCNIPMARLATQVLLGKKLPELNLKRKPVPHYGVKEAVFPFNMFPEVDPLLGPEMRSTGEVLGLAGDPGLAFFRAQLAANQKLPTEGTVLITVVDEDKSGAYETARLFHELGFTIRATGGTAKYLNDNGVPALEILKLHQGRPNITDAIKNGEIQLVINTPSGKRSVYDDSYIRKSAVRYKVPYITTIAAAQAAARESPRCARPGKRKRWPACSSTTRPWPDAGGTTNGALPPGESPALFQESCGLSRPRHCRMIGNSPAPPGALVTRWAYRSVLSP